MDKRLLTSAVAAGLFLLVVNSAPAQQMPMPSQGVTPNAIIVMSSGKAAGVPEICVMKLHRKFSGNTLEALSEEVKAGLKAAKERLESTNAPGLRVEIEEVDYSVPSAMEKLMAVQQGESMEEAVFEVNAVVKAMFDMKNDGATTAQRHVDAVLAAVSKIEGLELRKIGFAAVADGELEKQAIDDAIKNSKVEAEAIAASAGVRLGRLNGVSVMDMSEMMSEVMGGMFKGMPGPTREIMGMMYQDDGLSENPDSITKSALLFVSYELE